MVTELHHAIVISTFDEEYALAAHVKARALGCTISSIDQSPMNLLYSFMVCPDGSKEGWEESDEGDAQRRELIEFLRIPYTTLMGMEPDPEDRSTPYSWVEVSYGHPEEPAKVTDYGDKHSGEQALADSLGRCKKCGGTGRLVPNTGRPPSSAEMVILTTMPCPDCDGSGKFHFKKVDDQDMAELFKLAMANTATGPLTASPHVCQQDARVAPQAPTESKESYADRVAKELSKLGVDLEPIHITNYDYGLVMDPATKLDDRVELRDLDDEDRLVLFRFKRADKPTPPRCDHRLEYRRRDTFSTAGVPNRTGVREVCTGCGVVLFDTNPDIDKTSSSHEVSNS